MHQQIRSVVVFCLSSIFLTGLFFTQALGAEFFPIGGSVAAASSTSSAPSSGGAGGEVLRKAITFMSKLPT